MALVYIVEDDINIREIESFSLKNSGYTVEEFEDTKKFWKRINEGCDVTGRRWADYSRKAS